MQRKFMTPRLRVEPQVIRQKNQKILAPAADNILCAQPQPQTDFSKVNKSKSSGIYSKTKVSKESLGDGVTLCQKCSNETNF